MKHKKRIVAAVMALLMAAGCFIFEPVPDARAITQEAINQLKERAQSIRNEISGYQAQINELEMQGKKTLAQKELYDEQCSLLTEQIQLTEEQIAAYEELVAVAKQEYDDAVAAEEAQYELMCERIRAMEERGTISYMEIVFEASSFADLLGRIDFIDEVMQSDEDVIIGWQKLQQEKLDRQSELAAVIEETEAVKAELEVQKGELEAKRAEAEALMAEIQANQEEYERLVAEREKDAAELKNQIAKAEAEYAEQIRKPREAAAAAAAAAAARNRNNGSGQSTSGGGSSAAGISLAWPTSSHKITSGFGRRSASATNGVGSTNHMGIDIGGVGYDSRVSAAAGGIVTVATNSRSAGNYVAVSHGNGVVTLYMHLSSYSVSVGDRVSQGDKLGITG
ncbi:MAG: peptidoglycan DD-metalloendopeptidase family protein, partial [Oscillospiraceae bacterium]|nr:peptidoglycan DD-metalloendopeptidase family protein [Oscillospiraceae bacterium]